MFFRGKTIAVLLFWVVFFMPSESSVAQKNNDIIVVDQNDDPIPFAWAGGLNAPQFSEIDLNDDGIMDLFVFDREGYRVMTFLNNGTTGQVDYEYAPEYESAFPEMAQWCLLADYNNDGKNDIFTYNNGGIRVFKNTSSAGNLSFSLEVDPYIESNNGSGLNNIYVSPIDLPAIVDVDFDGDLDVLSFGLNSDQITFYENFAADSNDLESFKFWDNTYCWGNFREDAATNRIIFNATCPKIKVKLKGNKHGGASILAFDPDRDMDIDITLGDPTFTNLVFLENGGDNSYANMVDQDTLFPAYDVSVDLKFFPAAFYLDVNNDGLKDLIVAPNTRNGIENFAGVSYYENTGTVAQDDFTLRTQSFLQEDMIELGSWSYPYFFDHNFDGLLDIVVGNGTKYDGTTSVSSLHLFENIGTSNDPKYKLIDEDYADVSQINLNISDNTPTIHMNPAFGDINADGVEDMLIGDFEGHLHHFQNQPKNGKSDFVLIEANYSSIYKGNFARPYIIDLNEDGARDIVIGRQNGLLNYYENKGTGNVPKFDSLPDDTRLGDVNTKPWNEFDGWSQPFFYRADNDLYMVSGSINGAIFQYNDIQGNIDGSFNVIDTFLLDIDAGNRSHVQMADLNNDGQFEIIIGNSRGGIELYNTGLIVNVEELKIPITEEFKFDLLRISENEVILKVNRKNKTELRVFNIVGREIYRDNFNESFNLNMTDWSGGIYLISIENDGEKRTKKIIVSK